MENIFKVFVWLLRNIFSQIHINLVPDCYISSYMSLTNSLVVSNNRPTKRTYWSNLQAMFLVLSPKRELIWSCQCPMKWIIKRSSNTWCCYQVLLLVRYEREQKSKGSGGEHTLWQNDENIIYIGTTFDNALLIDDD